MKLKEYFQTYEFEEIYPYIGVMYPKARKQRKAFQHAYDILLKTNPVASKKYIQYQLMQDPDTNDMFFGSDDSNFNGPWDVLLGKEIKIDSNVDLTKEEIVANCFLNTILIGRHPREFEADYIEISR